MIEKTSPPVLGIIWYNKEYVQIVSVTTLVQKASFKMITIVLNPLKMQVQWID